MTKSQGIFIAFGILFFLFIGCAMYFNGNYNLNKIKSKQSVMDNMEQLDLRQIKRFIKA